MGRGAQCILAGRDDVVRVFVYAPAEERLERLRARLGDEAAAWAELAEVDRTRNAYVRRYHGCDRADRSCYDLMISSHGGLDRAIRLILAAVERGGAGA